MRRLLASIAVLAMTAGTSHAVQWHILGARPAGMGGAFVAVAQGPLATYWNPGGLAQPYNPSGLEVSGGVRVSATGSVLQGANDLHKVVEACNGSTTDCTAANITTALDNLGQPGNGALADAGVSAAVKIKRLTVFVHNIGYAGVTPQVDLVNNAVGNVANNTSKLMLRGILTHEVGVGYGHELLPGINVGGNLKMIIGQAGYDTVAIATDDPGSGSFSDYNDNTKTSSQFGADLGVLWDMRETLPSLPMRPRVGLVARNINNPKFKNPAVATAAGERNKIPVNGQLRAGAAISPLKMLTIAADLDMTDNTTYVDTMRSRYFGIGAEFNPLSFLPVRAGIQKNISKQAYESLAYTFGFGLNFRYVKFDLGGSVSSQKTKLESLGGEDDEIPNNLGVQASLAILFGSSADQGPSSK